MRKFSRGWVAGVFIALLLAGLALFGLPDLLGGGGGAGNNVAVGRGFAISPFEYQNEVDRVLQNARAQGRALTREDAVEAGVHTDVLNQMISERAIAAAAERAGAVATDRLIGQEIRRIPEFQDQITGQFDADQYRRLLAQNNLSVPQFEGQVRRQVLAREFVLGLVAGVRPPSSFTNFLVTLNGERRVIDVAQIPVGRVPEPAAATEAEIEAFYTQNRARFATPEYRAVTLVIADREDFLAKAQVPEDDLRKAYEARRRSLSTPERRSFVQVTAPDAARARQAAQRLEAGEDADLIAADVGGQAVPFDEAAREDIPDDAVAAAVFAADEGGVTGAIDGLSWSAARITAVTPATERSFEEVRGELEADLRGEQAEALLAEAEEAFTSAIDEGTSLEDAARAAGLPIVAAPAIDAQGRGRNRAPEPALAGTDEVLEAIFEMGVEDQTDFLPAGDGRYALARVDALIPPGVTPLEQVRAQIVAELREQRRREAVLALAREVEAAVEGGRSFADAARAARIPLAAEGQSVDRSITQGGPQAALGQAIFAAPEGDVITAPAPPGSGAEAFVVRIAEIQRQDPKTMPPEMLAQARQALSQQLTGDIGLSMQAAVIEAARVRRNERLALEALGVSPEAVGDGEGG